PGLPDEILEDIFIRLDSAADLARANAACTTFHRVVSARRFLRRYRSLHAPPVLGSIVSKVGKFHPAEPAHRSAPAARAVARAAVFTFSFLPKPNRWRTRDVRDGRVLLAASASSLEDLVVCDPLHRRYVEIPPMPIDLLACIPPVPGDLDVLEFEPFLAPASEEEESSFRVICNVVSAKKEPSFLQPRNNGDRSLVSSQAVVMEPLALKCLCFYWTHPFRKNLLVLDTGEMKFSFVDLLPKSLGTPLQHLALKHAVVELGEGRLGLLTLGSDGLELYLRDNGADAQEWRHSKTVPMPKDRWCIIIGATEGYVLILQTGSSPHMPDPQYFTLELKTMMIERLSKMCSRISHHHLYANFPPPLSPPNI
uniref:F-box domain-containing protein n=1 Tax=Setaria italica TaxID=4555 RepID=K3ZDW8_SETIT